MTSRLRGRLLLLAGTTAVALVLAEGAVRVSGRAPGFSASFGQHAASNDLILGWTNAPNAEGINSVGLRGLELREPKRGVRILVLGDSVAFGFKLQADETIPRKLEAKLRERGVDAEVLNAGVVAYNSQQEGRWLEVYGPALAPDHVVVLYCLNDTTQLGGNVPEDLAREAHKHGQKDDWERTRDLPSLSPVVRGLLTWSHLARLVYYRFTAQTALPVAGNAGLVGQGWSKDFAAVVDGFGRVASYCRQAKIPATVAIMPWLERLDAYPNKSQHEQVAQIATSLGIEVVDLLPAFADHAAKAKRSLALENDPVHPNAEGAGVAAAAIAEVVATRPP